jgi:hypothetical protein
MVATAPRRRGRIRTLTRGRADFCSVRLRGDELVAAAPITARGRTYLDELSTVALLDVPLELADEDGTPAPIAEVVAQAHGLVVALDGPDGTPPLRKAGYWTDGVRFVSAAVTSAGRRLFFDGERDVVRTNVLSYLTAG